MKDFFKLKISPSGLIEQAGLLASVATAAGLFGRYFWLLDLACHFRVQYFVVLLGASIALCLWRRYWFAAAFGACAALNAAFLAPLFFGAPLDVQAASPRLKALLINVSRSHGDPERVIEFVRRNNPDFIVIEEVSPKWRQELGPLEDTYPHRVMRTREDDFGIAVLSKRPFLSSGIVHLGSAEVPSVYGQFEVGGATLTLVGTHPLPPAGPVQSRHRNDQLEQLPAFVGQFDGPLLLLGDLNVTPWSYHFRKLLNDSGLRDAGKGRGIRPTWPAFAFPFLIPIDHCLHSDGIIIAAKSVGDNVGSDHYPVIVEFALTD